METKLMEILLAPEVIVLSAAIIALLQGVGQIPLKRGKLSKATWWRRVLPILPLAIGVAGAFAIGRFNEETAPLATPILTGLWSGFVAAHGRKVVKRLVLDKLKGKEE